MNIWVVGPIAWDSVLYLENNFTDAGYTHVNSKTERPGGQGLNVASGLRDAKLNVKLVGYLGNCSNSSKLSNFLKEQSISDEYISKIDKPSPNIMVLVDKSGERKMVGLEKSYFHEVRLPIHEIKPNDIVVWTWWRDDFEGDFKACTKIGGKTIVGIEALTNSNIDANLFIGNKMELLSEKFDKSRTVVITDGANGAVLIQDGRELKFEAKSDQVVDTTGAGDALLAGTIVGIARGKSIEESLRIGINWAVATIGTESSLPAKWSEKYIELAS